MVPPTGSGRARTEGHGPPETDPPGGLVEVLQRWETTGGQWRVVRSSDTWIELDLCSSDGEEQVSRVSGARTTVLRSFLAGRTSSAG